MLNRKRCGHRFATQRGTLNRVILWVMSLGALVGIGWVGHLGLITHGPHSGDFSRAYAQPRPSTSSASSCSRLKKHALELAHLREELEQQKKLFQSLIAQSQSLTRKQSQRIARLEGKLRQHRRQLNRLERDHAMVERLAEKQSGSVGLILGEYIWIDQATGQPLRYEEGETPGTIRPWPDGHISVGIGGRGPVVVREFSGTGFLVDAAGRVLTSGYLLAPWERDPIARQAHTMGLRPRLRLLHIYFPSVDRPFDLKIVTASDRGEAVLCQFDPGSVRLTPLSLPSGKTNVLTGAPIVLLGYPGGVELIAARLPEAALRGIEVSTLRTHDELAQRLARAGLIRPLAIGGRISGQYHGRLFYDGTTTFGASGGPLLNARGEVVGIEFAISPEFSGSNLAIPITSLQRWLAETGVGLPRSEQAKWRPVSFQ